MNAMCGSRFSPARHSLLPPKHSPLITHHSPRITHHFPTDVWQCVEINEAPLTLPAKPIHLRKSGAPRRTPRRGAYSTKTKQIVKRNRIAAGGSPVADRRLPPPAISSASLSPVLAGEGRVRGR